MDRIVQTLTTMRKALNERFEMVHLHGRPRLTVNCGNRPEKATPVTSMTSLSMLIKSPVSKRGRTVSSDSYVIVALSNKGYSFTSEGKLKTRTGNVRTAAEAAMPP